VSTLPALGRIARAACVPALTATLACACATRAGALPVTGLVPGPWLSVGVLGGSTQFDPHLADYAWNVNPRAGFGAEALAGFGPVGGGVRVWRARTSQHLGLAEAPDPSVDATSFDVVGRLRLFSLLGAQLQACASTGRLHLGYSPDHVLVGSGGSAVDVALAPVDAWSYGAGLAVRRGLVGAWAAGVEVDAQRFSMETAHRSGSTIVTGNERFNDWSARLGLERVFGRR
jgi:hypothetical protein